MPKTAKEVAEDTEIKRLLKKVLEHFDNEDAPVRERQLRSYRRLKLYWNNFSQIYWSETARDYRIYASDTLGSNDTDSQQDYYDRPVNVFKAFLETIIAALSIQIPAINCVPDDADNPNDLTTAKVGDKISELIYKHNDVIFLWLYGLYVHMTEGMVACYSYADEDEKYGTYEEKEYKDETIEAYVCPNCKARVPDELLAEKELDEFEPDDEDSELHSILMDEGPVCPECAAELDPELQKSKLVVPRFVGMTSKPKSRICLEVFGGLYVKIANYAKDQKGTPYLIKSHETHYANALECFPDLWEQMPQGGWTNTGINEPYAQMARLNPQYRNSFPEEQVTIKEGWLRPAAFNILTEEESEKLHKKFPDGAKITMVNDICAEYEAEALDDCWTLTKNPMHDFLSHDPIGELLTNIQDITNDLISLTLQTIEHGIEQTWADPSVVNFEGISQIEAMPGTLTPTKNQGGSRNISEAFYSTKAASLSPEVFQFYNIIQQLGQFISGALPSVFGGQMDAGSSRTAAEYAQSRAMALQRLQTTWKMFGIWWKNIFGKCIPAYIKLVKSDERYVFKDDNGNFVNVWIRKAELSGKIGSVELEASEQMPISDEQKADMVMRLFELNNQEIIAAIASPENLPFIRKIVKMPEFVLPGEDDRTNEFRIITEMQSMEPTVTEPDPLEAQMALANGMEPQPIELPAIPVDPEIDNSEIGKVICRGWLVSEAGQLAKMDNPAGYKNVLLRLRQHNQISAQQQQAALQQQIMIDKLMGNNNPQQPNNKAKSPKKNSESSEVDDVSTVQ
jgi:hypothetical protein